MKKNIFWGTFLLTACMVCSCSQEEVVSEVATNQAISFDTYVGRNAQTRASVATKTTLEGSNEGFGVFGYYTEDDDWSSSATPNFMYNQQVTYTDGAWGYDPIKYWPDGNISFYAYAPYSENGYTLSANNVADAPTLTYTMPDDVDDQVDLLISDAKLDQTITDPVVDFTFYHALSRIGFAIKAEANALDNATTVEVTGITLSGKFAKSNTVTLGIPTPTTPATWGTATLSDTKISYELAGDMLEDGVTPTATATALNSDEGYLMLLPQAYNTDGNKLSLAMTYNLVTTDNKLAGGKFSASYTCTANDIAVNFEPGKAYTFVFVLKAASDGGTPGDPSDDEDPTFTPVQFNVINVTAWDETPEDIEIPE